MKALCPPQRFDSAEIERTLALLAWGPQVCAELRALGNREIGIRHGTISGYFNNIDQMAQAAAHWSGKVEGVYFVLNPCPRRLLWRTANRLRLYTPRGSTTQDSDIERRRWQLVDLDPVRPSGLAATAEEHALALERARAVRDYLRHEGLTGLVLADSGNGGHVLVPYFRPNDDSNRDRAAAFLQGLAERFDDSKVIVDQTTFNAARLCKLYGTMSCKGDPDELENPHRLSRILEVDE